MPKTKAEKREYMKAYMAARRGKVNIPEVNKVNESGREVNKTADIANLANRLANKSANTANRIPWIEGADLSKFDGHGRGEPVAGLVMVARQSPTLVRGEYTGELVGVVPESVWRARLDAVCAHGFHGWACKTCLA